MNAMKGKLYVMRPDGTGLVEELFSVPVLEDLQIYVGGYIEVVPFFHCFLDRDCVAFCNEEGKNRGLPMNTTATQLWHDSVQFRYNRIINDVLFGCVVIIVGDRELLDAL